MQNMKWMPFTNFQMMISIILKTFCTQRSKLKISELFRKTLVLSLQLFYRELNIYQMGCDLSPVTLVTNKMVNGVVLAASAYPELYLRGTIMNETGTAVCGRRQARHTFFLQATESCLCVNILVRGLNETLRSQLCWKNSTYIKITLQFNHSL